jgi:hypothetical protein
MAGFNVSYAEQHQMFVCIILEILACIYKNWEQ